MAVINLATPVVKVRSSSFDESGPHVREFIPSLMNRTLEQIEKDRADLKSCSNEPRALPSGKNLEDLIVGEWPGDETDEEIAAALADLS